MLWKESWSTGSFALRFFLICAVAGLKLEGVTEQGKSWHAGAHSRSCPIDSKEMETSVIKSQELSSASEKNELRIGVFSRASRELSSANTLISAL